MTGVIAAHEFLQLFRTPLAWLILAVLQLVLAYFFLINLDVFTQYQPQLIGMENAPGLTDIVVSSLYRSAGVVMFVVLPLVAMRTLSEERQNGTVFLLYSAPISIRQIVFGKYLGVVGFCASYLLMITLMPLALLLGGSLDWGHFLACVLALVLLLPAIAAIALYFSSLTASPALAAVYSFGTVLLLWVIDWGSAAGTAAATGMFKYLSLKNHLQPLLQGMINSTDVVYFLVISILFLMLTMLRLQANLRAG